MNSVFIQNLISPYRNRFFNLLGRHTNEFGVYYMGYSEPDRNWDTSKFERNYLNWVDEKGHYFQIGSLKGHFNPRLIWKLLRNNDINNIILAVSWQDLNIVILCLVKILHLTNKRYFFWAEANYTAMWTNKRNSKLKWWVKRKVFSAIDGALVIPGKMSEITFEKWGIPVANYIYLPNTIDDLNLKYDPNKRTAEDLPVFIMPFRIIERVKGGLNFFKSIGKENVYKAKFIIAGDGEDKAMYENFIKENGYEDNIVLEGFCDSAKMTELYNKVNALILPSYTDPSPLSLVEALLFHLPILCSNHCGNHFEAVHENENGLIFSPLEPMDIKDKFEKFLSMRSSWKVMGEKSNTIYEEAFDTEKVVNQFLNSFDKLKKS